MSFDALRLYELLPAIYRIRDTEQGEPLKALLAVIAEQVGVLEENLEQLYDDQFIETCADWVVPYIGDLIGYRALHNVAPKIDNQRAEVAHTIAFRRRKGTTATLEQMARDVTNWDARAVEFFELLGWTQHVNHIRPACLYSPDLRNWETLERLDTAFDTAAHTVEVRRITTGQGKHNIPNIGIFLWRLRAHPLTRSPAFKVDKVDSKRFRFDPLGKDMQLFTHPKAEEEVTHLAEPINVAEPISRRVMARRLDLYYGEGKSIFIEGISTDKVNVCNLADAGGDSWAHTASPGSVAIDPVLGRIAFGDAPAHPPPLVTFHYGFGADIGGGEYDRAGTLDAKLNPLVKFPGAHASLQLALNAEKNGGVAEISDSGRYPAPAITVNAKQRIELRSANNHRPLIDGDMNVDGGLQSEVTLNGLVVSGAVRLPAAGGNNLRRLRLQHCTLVPTAQPSLIVDIADVTIEIDHCITGGLRIVEGAHVEITDSIIDATAESAVAFARADGIGAGGSLQLIDSTVIGKVHTKEMKLVSNTIFVATFGAGDPWIAKVGAPIRSEKKQVGCVRFSYLPAGSQTPRRYRCEPELEITMRIEQAEKELNRRISDNERNAIRGDVESWLVPSFTALQYGLPGYAQLRLSCPRQIRMGAEDEAEMGAFHELYEPQRETNLRVRLDEYLRFGLEAGIFYVS